MLRSVVAAATVVTLIACGTGSQDDALPDFPTPASTDAGTTLLTPEADTTPTPAAPLAEVRDPVLYAVGDIASCTTTGDEKVAALLRGKRGRIAVLGDAVYPSGTAAEYRRCFDPAWGPLARRLRPAPGNHDYRTSGAAGYFDYFGRRAGEVGKGWYFYDLGPHWRAIVLNSECAAVGGCDRESPQGRWLRRTLAASGNRHVLAYWHAPLFSTGKHGPNPVVKPLWRQLRRAGAALVLGGHDHVYERFAPQDPDGRGDPDGIRQFTVGTGGYTLYGFRSDPDHNTQTRDNTSFGVLRLRLEPDGYRWRFIPATGAFTDRGSHRLN